VECELCKTAIRAELEVSRRCNSCGESKARIGEGWLLFVVCLFGVVFNLSLIAYSALQLRVEIRNGYGAASMTEKIVVLLSIVLNLLLLVFFAWNLSNYFLHR
jgi:hypothetical protein